MGAMDSPSKETHRGKGVLSLLGPWERRAPECLAMKRKELELNTPFPGLGTEHHRKSMTPGACWPEEEERLMKPGSQSSWAQALGLVPSHSVQAYAGQHCSLLWVTEFCNGLLCIIPCYSWRMQSLWRSRWWKFLMGCGQCLQKCQLNVMT